MLEVKDALLKRSEDRSGDGRLRTEGWDAVLVAMCLV